jgi:ankyrin repeat protein
MAQGEPVDEPDSRGNTPLHYAAQKDYVEVALALLAADADTGARNARGRTPMHMAAKAGSDAVMHLLRDHGAPEWVQDKEAGLSPFDVAVMHNRIGAAEFLLRIPGTWGFKVDHVSENEVWPALHIAAAEGFGQMVEFLLDAGFDPRALDDNGETAAQVAQQRNHMAIARRLREREARGF